VETANIDKIAQKPVQHLISEMGGTKKRAVLLKTKQFFSLSNDFLVFGSFFPRLFFRSKKYSEHLSASFLLSN
jgi:hypothetical protein